MTLKVAKRGAISPFIVMDVMRAANERQARGEGVLHMEVGQPSTGAPKAVCDAARAALEQDRLGYTDAFGLPGLRSAIAGHYQRFYGVSLDPARVVVTTGSSGAFLLSFLAAFDAGDRVALASPGYPAYRNILRALDIDVVDVLTGPDTNFQPTPALLDKVPGRLDGLIVASPSNPAGTMIPSEPFKAIVHYCEDRGVRLVSDEIYHGITYGTKADTALAISDTAIVVNSFSKYFSMTGWRLGWMVAPESLMRSVECLAQNFFISPPTISQHAAIAAFGCYDDLDANVRRYAENRAHLLEELPKAGFTRLTSADGAFYLYADVAGLTNDSAAFCKKILAETGVAITPGIDFDPQRGSRYVRFSFAGSTEDMVEAAKRLNRWRA
ncbi:MAG: pyridoxal phosphate-dependent aminotransferase [Rhodospirillales bacterium]|nr:pyridoxal phosphate-dependent aminotransferase [Rhodospirillales bacterium]